MGMTVHRTGQLARQLMAEHGLDGWAYRPGRAAWEYGSTCWGTRVIRVSTVIAARVPAAETRDTILHEIAHVLSSDRAHSAAWQHVAARIGARPEALGPYLTAESVMGEDEGVTRGKDGEG